MTRNFRVRIISNWNTVITGILAAICVLVSIVGYQKYMVLSSTMENYISCEDAAHELQLGSDILTKYVRLAAATGKQEYIDEYFNEANVSKHRERALSDLSELDSQSKALKMLEKAMASSKELMETEFYAMRLVEEAIHADPAIWNDKIKECELSPEDATLSDEEKLHRAQELVISEEYENAKDSISGGVNAALTTLSALIINRQNSASLTLSHVLRIIIFCIALFAGMMLLNGLIMTFWIVRPIIKYTESIRKGPLPEIKGVTELRLLADTYNKVYRENEERESLLKHRAEHDPLTELLNRGSFDRILDLYEKEQAEFCLILIDIDTFKTFNDTYGHAVGDAILKRVSALLRSTFRSIDYVFRIGGDEFAVIMVNMESSLNYVIMDKFNEMKKQLAVPENGLPAVTLSAGAAFTDRKNPGPNLFKDADKALYYTKEHGRNNCTTYPIEKTEE